MCAVHLPRHLVGSSASSECQDSGVSGSAHVTRDRPPTLRRRNADPVPPARVRSRLGRRLRSRTRSSSTCRSTAPRRATSDGAARKTVPRRGFARSARARRGWASRQAAAPARSSPSSRSSCCRAATSRAATARGEHYGEVSRATAPPAAALRGRARVSDRPSLPAAALQAAPEARDRLRLAPTKLQAQAHGAGHPSHERRPARTARSAPSRRRLDGRHVVFGKVLEGMDVEGGRGRRLAERQAVEDGRDLGPGGVEMPAEARPRPSVTLHAEYRC